LFAFLDHFPTLSYLFSAGEIEATPCDSTACCQYSVFNSSYQCGVENCCGYDIKYNNSLKWVLLYHLFGLLWTSHFVVGVSLCIIAGGVSSYYWSRGDISVSCALLLTDNRE
jgi:choline transporter-like protein 2/4/5